MIRRIPKDQDSKLPFDHTTPNLSGACGIDGEYRLEEIKKTIEIVKTTGTNSISEIVERLESYMIDRLNSEDDRRKYIRYLAMILALYDTEELKRMAKMAAETPSAQ